MNEYGRNVVVGFFVLLGMVVLALLIVKFQSTVGYFSGSDDYYIEIEAEQTAAILPGQTVHLNGKPVGRIRSVELAEDPRDGVIITAAIRQQYSIPEDVAEVSIYQGQLGPPFIQIRVLPSHSAVMLDKTPNKVVARLKADIPGDVFGELSELAKELRPSLVELGPALAQIGALAENLNEMLAGSGAGSALEQGEGEGTDIKSLAKRFSQTLDNLNALIGDEENRENFKQSLVNLRQAGKDASEALTQFKVFAGHAEETTSEVNLQVRDVAQAIIRNSEQLGELLGHLNRAAEQMNEGQGSVGKILHDPQLYEEMLSTTEQLNEALQMLRHLLEKWNKQGMELKW